MSRTNTPRDLAAAARVHAAREEIVQALGPLAASPLDEGAVGQMRVALERADSPAVRRAVRALVRPGEGRPALVIVPRDRPDGTRSQAPPAVRDRVPVALVASGGDAA